MKDSWCKQVIAKSGSMVSGGAARNVRIAASGGMDKIVETVATRAALKGCTRPSRRTFPAAMPAKLVELRGCPVYKTNVSACKLDCKPP